jgi:16S rRNA C967 or C1407 C5-methylase (RsmB/RsmF family)
MLHRFRPFLQILKDISIKRTMSSTEIQPEWTINSQKKYHFLVKSNDKFEKYYFAQKVVDTEEEWKTCLESMRQELPQSFRLNTSRPTTVKHLAKILDNFSQIKPKTWPGGKYPTVWQFDSTSRWQLKEDPKLDHLFKLLVSERDCGNLSRQEMVSMIPVMLLDVQSHYRVLDMCSAPGSKTKQVVESLHADFVKGLILHIKQKIEQNCNMN